MVIVLYEYVYYFCKKLSTASSQTTLFDTARSIIHKFVRAPADL